MKDYIEAANSTKGDKFHGQMVGMFYFLNAAREFIEAANHLDAIKKTLFYGKKLYKIDEGFTWGGVNLAGYTDAIHPDIFHAIIGVATEAGEMMEALVKTIEGVAAGEVTAIDEVNLKEESGDVLWYLAVLFKRIETDFGAEAKRNIAKLMLRYPAGFSQENALVRDIAAERKLLESEPA